MRVSSTPRVGTIKSRKGLENAFEAMQLAERPTTSAAVEQGEIEEPVVK
jgi:hypothetical protein